LYCLRDSRLIAGLEIQITWGDYKENLQGILTQPPNSPAFQAALQGVESLSSDLVQKSDNAVRLYEAISTQKIIRLRWIQAIFLAGAILLLAAGTWMMRDTVIVPLHNFGRIARRIGSGDLIPVEVTGPRNQLLRRISIRCVSRLGLPCPIKGLDGQLEQRETTHARVRSPLHRQ
jgi:hypothetical protein